MIQVACPWCRTVLRVDRAHAGKIARCPKCNETIQIPAAGAARPAPMAAPPMPPQAAVQPPPLQRPVVQTPPPVIQAASVPPRVPVAATPPPRQPQASAAINSVLSRFANDEQDPAIVEQVHVRIVEILTRGEEIQYIAVQKKPVLNMTPDCAVLTNRRFIIYKPKLLGRVSFVDFAWRDLQNATIQEGMMGATLSFQTTLGQRVSMDYLPKVQARKLYRFAQEMEEKALVERRQLALEETRAAAGGGIVMHTGPSQAPVPAASHQDDSVQRLTKLKAMIDAGLISQAEFDAKKADILGSL